MKKTISLLLALFVVLSIAPVGLFAGAEDGYYTSGIWTYGVYGGYAIITKCSGTGSGTITVPETLGVQQYPVEGWNNAAFNELKDFEFVVPASVVQNHIDYWRLYGGWGDGYTDEFILWNSGGIPSLFNIAANAFRITGDSPHIISKDGAIYTKDLSVLIKYPVCKKDTFFALPETVDLVQSSRFYGLSPFWVQHVQIGEDGGYENEYIVPKGLTVHISAAQMQAVYDFSCAAFGDPDTAWEIMAGMFDPAVPREDADDVAAAYGWTLIPMGASTVCTDWISPKHNGKDMIDYVNSYFHSLSTDPYSESGLYELVHCDGHTGGVVNASMSIQKPSVTTIKYGHTLVLHTQTANLPAGATVRWSVEGSGVSIEPSADTFSCNVKSVSSGSATVKAQLVDKNGNPIKDASGNAIVSQQSITSSAGFFQKLIYFFKSLFGINTTIPQAVKELFFLPA